MLYSFYFVHISKSAGTSVYANLPDDYKDRYYGERGKISLDHLTIQTAYDLNIINDEDINTKEFIVLWRNPIDRFVSTCNHLQITPDIMIDRIELHRDNPLENQYGQRSFYMTATDILQLNGKRIKTTDLLYDDADNITNVFRKHNINYDHVVSNTSYQRLRTGEIKKVFTKNQLTEKHLRFIVDFYKKDIVYYNTLYLYNNIC